MQTYKIVPGGPIDFDMWVTWTFDPAYPWVRQTGNYPPPVGGTWPPLSVRFHPRCYARGSYPGSRPEALPVEARGRSLVYVLASDVAYLAYASDIAAGARRRWGR